MNRGAKRETQHGQAHILPLELDDFFLIRFDLNSTLFDFVELRLEKEILLQEDVVGSPETRTSLSGPKRAFEKLLSFFWQPILASFDSSSFQTFERN